MCDQQGGEQVHSRSIRMGATATAVIGTPLADVHALRANTQQAQLSTPNNLAYAQAAARCWLAGNITCRWRRHGTAAGTVCRPSWYASWPPSLQGPHPAPQQHKCTAQKTTPTHPHGIPTACSPRTSRRRWTHHQYHPTCRIANKTAALRNGTTAQPP